MDFSFRYDGVRCTNCSLTLVSSLKERENGAEKRTDFYEIDNLRVERVTKLYPNGAEYSLTYFENVSDRCTKILSDIFDVDDELALSSPSPEAGFVGYGQKGFVVLRDWKGSVLTEDDFGEESVVMDGRSYEFIASAGRPSQINLPFFDIGLDETGYLYSIGWTGRWFARFRKDESKGKTDVKIGIYDTNFYLAPGERIRTVGVLKYRYKNGRIEGYNALKRTIKEYFVAERIKKKPLPFCLAFWGGSSSEYIFRRLEEAKNRGIDFDCLWLDAGWCGDYKELCPSEFFPAWSTSVGNWYPNRMVHPGELKDLSEKIHENGKSFLLWFEPERANMSSKLFQEHRDWFLLRKESDCDAILDLSKKEPREYVIKLIGDYIETLKIDVYRQDFNVDSICYWVQNDPLDRRGMKEIGYVMGLYEFWDALLARFPDLLIDNCASGGRRIDLETISRSVPLWRSDYQCCFDREAEALQIHNANISTFLPYSGSGTGVILSDKYRRRSCYSSAMATSALGYEFISKDTLDWDVASAIEEFKSVREYFSCDFYPVFGHSVSHEAWGGWQFDRPDRGDGILMAFRRDECPLDRAIVEFGGLDENAKYELFDVDSGKTEICDGKRLKSGYAIEINKKRDSRLIKYKKIKE